MKRKMYHRQLRIKRVCDQLCDVLRSESKEKDLDELVSDFSPFMLLLCEYLHSEVDMSFLHDAEADKGAHDSVNLLLKASKDHLSQIKDSLMFEPDWIESGGLSWQKDVQHLDTLEESFIQIFEEWKDAESSQRKVIIADLCASLSSSLRTNVMAKGCMGTKDFESLIELTTCEGQVCEFFKSVESHLQESPIPSQELLE